MKRCPITYEEIRKKEKYSKKGLKNLSPVLSQLYDFPYSAKEQVAEAIARAEKMSIQGVQPKLSVRLNVKEKIFEVVDAGGNYILKPQHGQYESLPENEDLTMKLAETAQIEVPFHSMVYAKDGSLSYFIKRFDRLAKNQKVPIEDFAQLAGKNRETKYDFSLEKIVAIIESFCTFPAIDKLKLFRLTLFNYLTGNEDMHLKNYSLLRTEDKVQLSPAYDLINTTIAVKGTSEETALSLAGKKKNLTQKDLLEYFAQSRLGLNEKTIKSVLNSMAEALKQWDTIINRSFLLLKLKEQYKILYKQRAEKMGIY